MNKAIKIVIICAICAATLMSGCMESTDTESVDNVSTDTVSTDATSKGTESSAKTTSNTATLKPPLTAEIPRDPADMGNPQNAPYITEVVLYEDGTALFHTVGAEEDESYDMTWTAFRSTANSQSFDLHSEIDMPIRLSVQEGGAAILELWDIQFKGTWNSGISKVSPPAAATQKVLALQIGDLATNDYLEVQISDVSRSEYYDWDVSLRTDDIYAEPGNVFILATGRVKNVGYDKIVRGTSDFTMIDSKGSRYVAGAYVNKDKMDYIENLRKGQQCSGVILFEVPEDATGLKIQYDYGTRFKDMPVPTWSID